MFLSTQASDVSYQYVYDISQFQFLVFVSGNVSLPCLAAVKDPSPPKFLWIKWKWRDKNDTDAIKDALSRNDLLLDVLVEQSRTTENRVRTSLQPQLNAPPRTNYKTILTDAHYKLVHKDPVYHARNKTWRFDVDLTFTNASQSDEGFYTCIVTDDVISAHNTIFLKVENEGKFFM